MMIVIENMVYLKLAIIFTMSKFLAPKTKNIDRTVFPGLQDCLILSFDGLASR